jgi:hypothetical protein
MKRQLSLGFEVVVLDLKREFVRESLHRLWIGLSVMSSVASSIMSKDSRIASFKILMVIDVCEEPLFSTRLSNNYYLKSILS